MCRIGERNREREGQSGRSSEIKRKWELARMRTRRNFAKEKQFKKKWTYTFIHHEPSGKDTRIGMFPSQAIKQIYLLFSPLCSEVHPNHPRSHEKNAVW